MIVFVGLVSLLAGLFLGHRWATHDARINFAQLERGYQRVVGFAEDYIEANAPRQGHTVIRNDSGAIVDLLEPPIRCGTPALLAQKFLDEHRRRKALH